MDAPAASTGDKGVAGSVDLARGPVGSIETVFTTDFGESADCDFDGWPDQWTRRSGPGFPAFNRIALSEQAPPGGGRSLRMELEGGGAIAYSPPLPLSTLCDYLVEVHVKTEGIVHDRVFVSLSVLDPQGKAVQTFCSAKVPGSPQWSVLRLGPVSPDAPKAVSGILGLHCEPAAKADLKGAAMFGRIGVGRLPRIGLGTDVPSAYYVDPQRPTIRCRVSGLSKPSAQVLWELSDAYGRVVSQASLPLTIVRPKPDSAKTTEASGGPPRPGSELASGDALWSPPLAGPGFYRVRAVLESYPAELLRRELTMAVLLPDRTPPRSRFGWSLRDGERRMSRETLVELLSRAGVGWVKYPLWLEPDPNESGIESLSGFLRDLGAKGISPVGVLGCSPTDVLARFDLGRTPWAAEVFAASRDVWLPSLERTVVATAGQVRWWQLGADNDVSFVGYPGLETAATQVKRELDRIGRGLHPGICWNPERPLPSSSESPPPWRFVSMAFEPRGQGARPRAGPTVAPRDPESPKPMQRLAFDRWLTVQSLPRGKHPLDDRIRDLVEKMLAATWAGAEAVFLADPVDEEQGLVGDDGSPRELFLPWRTTAIALAGARPLEILRLPGGSTGHVLLRDDDAVMVAWSAKPTEETLDFGENVRQVDAWGVPQPVVVAQAGQRIRVTPLPSFITGLNKPIAMWRRSVRLERERIASVFSQRQPNRLEFKNTLEQPVAGSVALTAPKGWGLRPDRFEFRLKPGETLRQEFDLTLPNNVLAGAHELQASFEIASDPGPKNPRRNHRFHAYLPIQVGVLMLRMEFATRLNPRGDLEIEQRTINEGTRSIGLRCELFAPERQRLTTQVTVAPRSPSVSVYCFPDGRGLVGKTLWLQAQELGGSEVFNYQFVAQP